MSARKESVNVDTGRGDGAQSVQQQIPSLAPVTLNGREIWEDVSQRMPIRANFILFFFLKI